MLFYVAKSVGFNVSVSVRSDKKDIRLMCSSNIIESQKRVLKDRSSWKWFYRLCIWYWNSNGDFNGFPSIVKNTDSVFVKYQCGGKGNKLSGRAAESAYWINTDGSADSGKYIKSTKVLEYEKTFDPTILLKKRYVVIFMRKTNKLLKKYGYCIKRRDNAPIVKVIWGIIDIIMKQGDITPMTVYENR